MNCGGHRRRFARMIALEAAAPAKNVTKAAGDRVCVVCMPSTGVGMRLAKVAAGSAKARRRSRGVATRQPSGEIVREQQSSRISSAPSLAGAAFLGSSYLPAAAQGDHQGRHPSLALGHDGDQRDDAEGRHAHADRGAEQEGRPARQEARGRRGRPGLELAALRREGARADHARTRSRPCSAAGPRCRASPCCRCSRS